MKRALVAVLIGCVAMGFSSMALAGNNSQAGIAVHIGPEQLAKNICDSAGPLEDGSINHSEGSCSGLYSVYLLVCNGSHRNAELIAAVGGAGFDIDGTGVAGVDFAVNYDGALTSGMDVDAWFPCADVEFAQAAWPDAGSGGTWTWDSLNNCQGVPSPTTAPNEVIAVIGVMQVSVYGPDVLTIIPNPNSGEAAVIDCGSFNDRIDLAAPTHLGAGGFCAPGYNPCGIITPVEETTWGAIKKQFD